MQNKNWSKFANEVFVLQNKVRKDPQSFVTYLENRLRFFKGNRLYANDKKSFVETKEGKDAYVEAIEFLKV